MKHPQIIPWFLRMSIMSSKASIYGLCDPTEAHISGRSNTLRSHLSSINMNPITKILLEKIYINASNILQQPLACPFSQHRNPHLDAKHLFALYTEKNHYVHPCLHMGGAFAISCMNVVFTRLETENMDHSNSQDWIFVLGAQSCVQSMTRDPLMMLQSVSLL